MKKFLESKIATIIGLIIIFFICLLLDSCGSPNPLANTTWNCEKTTTLEITKDSVFVTDTQTDECELFSYTISYSDNKFRNGSMSWTDALGYKEKVNFKIDGNNLSIIYTDFEPNHTYHFNRVK